MPHSTHSQVGGLSLEAFARLVPPNYMYGYPSRLRPVIPTRERYVNLPSLPLCLLQEMIDEADKDGDGEVSEAEFLRIMKKTNMY